MAPILRQGFSFATGRAAKTQAIQDVGFSANSACFAGLVAIIASFRDAKYSRWVCAAAAGLVLVESFMLTARAPVLAFVVAAAGAWVLARSPILFRRFTNDWTAALIVAISVLTVPVVLFFLTIQPIAHSSAARALAGRAAIWQIGIDAVKQHPLIGSGPHTFTDVIRSNLGVGTFSASFEQDAIYSLTGGGFHNIWLNTLVERGFIGFIGLLGSYAMLIAFALQRLSSMDMLRRLMLLLLLLFVFLRGFVEIAGLMAYGDALTDALVMLAFAASLAPEPTETKSRFKHRAPVKAPTRRTRQLQSHRPTGETKA